MWVSVARRGCRLTRSRSSRHPVDRAISSLGLRLAAAARCPARQRCGPRCGLDHHLERHPFAVAPRADAMVPRGPRRTADPRLRQVVSSRCICRRDTPRPPACPRTSTPRSARSKALRGSGSALSQRRTSVVPATMSGSPPACPPRAGWMWSTAPSRIHFWMRKLTPWFCCGCTCRDRPGGCRAPLPPCPLAIDWRRAVPTVRLES